MFISVVTEIIRKKLNLFFQETELVDSTLDIIKIVSEFATQVVNMIYLAAFYWHICQNSFVPSAKEIDF